MRVRTLIIVERRGAVPEATFPDAKAPYIKTQERAAATIRDANNRADV